MTELLQDIEVLENALINIKEGASDEVYGALQSIEKLIAEKKASFEQFEKQMEQEANVISG